MKKLIDVFALTFLAFVFSTGCAHSSSDPRQTSATKIDRESIRQVIAKNLKSIKACYVKELKTHPGIKGKLVLEWDIGDQGRVVKAGVKSSELGDPEVGDCVVAQLQTWSFPEPPKNNEISVSYPFFFSE